MKTYTIEKQRINDWIWPRIGRESAFFPESSFQALGIEENGELIAGVIFEGFSSNARCSMHCAGLGRRWLTKSFLLMCFDYVFNQAGCKVVVNTVSADNADSIRFTEHVGFTEVGRVKDGACPNDLIIYQLHRDDCKWIKHA
jgi:RimJ/RimL family protein N-acetyltransferase